MLYTDTPTTEDRLKAFQAASYDAVAIKIHPAGRTEEVWHRPRLIPARARGESPPVEHGKRLLVIIPAEQADGAEKRVLDALWLGDASECPF